MVWKPGQSGNPKGRKPGAERVRQLLEPRRDELVQKAITLALDGDSKVLLALLDRIGPPGKSESTPVLVDGMAEAPTLTEKAQAVLGAVGKGEISPDVASTILGALASVGRIQETDELLARIEALETDCQAGRRREPGAGSD